MQILLVPGDDPALLRLPDIELLGIIRGIFEIIENKSNDRTFDIQTRHEASSHNCKIHRDPQAKLNAYSGSEDKINIPNYLNSSIRKTHMPDYFNSSDNKEADMRVSEAITKRIYNECNIFSGIGCFEGTCSLQVKRATIHNKHLQEE